MAKPTQEERLAELLAQVRQATADAHGALKDLRAEHRSIRATLDGAVEQVRAHLDKRVEDMARDLQDYYDRNVTIMRKRFDADLARIPARVDHLIAEAMTATLLDNADELAIDIVLPVTKKPEPGKG